MASVTEQPYEMWDMFGPYTETVALGAFDKTLAANPTVEFTLNHNRGGGAPMASTRNGTLELAAVKDGDLTGLSYDAQVDATRNDVSDMVKALDRGDLAEASFKFGITRGQWSPDFTEYRIEEVDMDGGDVTAANFGANPYATSSLRAPAAPKPGSDLVTERDLARPMQSLI
jgi:HK97 family phage prohead protease